MPIDIRTKTISDLDLQALLALQETHFADLKSAEIAPAKLTKTISAFANTSGGEIYIGIEEVETEIGKERKWQGFADQEAANPIFQVLEGINPLANNFNAVFLTAARAQGIVLQLTIFKTQGIVSATDGKAYVRRNAQSLPIANEAALERLKYDKGISTFEDELISIETTEISNSNTIIEFLLETIPSTEPDVWLSRQRLVADGRPSVAGLLLYSDNPQSVLPKRSAIKVLQISN